MIITIVAGARPNFMKIAPIIRAIETEQQNGKVLNYRLVHTGQHYDKRLSGDFFEELGIPEPDANLEAGSGTQAEQTAAIMIRFEKELKMHRPNFVLVVGDVTSTMACSITAKKMCIEVVHVEAGIRSGDMRMPEEINRMVTDAITDHFFTTSESANDNLRQAGVAESKIHFVGNTMIDTLMQNIHRVKQPSFWKSNDIRENAYYLLTLHRPVNVDDPSKLQDLLTAILDGTQDSFVVFPVHPRTKKQLKTLQFSNSRLLQIEPLGYLEFIYMILHAKAIITDSGGITEEATVLNIPCMTLRDSTERPETISIGSNELVGTDPANLLPYLERLQNGQWKTATTPPLWDGHTSQRIVGKLLEIYCAEPEFQLENS